ncbi:glycosyltransferase family 9 protein [Parasutterella excrementihominis]|uniref:glycosyltransferase family 9 protein n=2 Tax=Parasutterella TaxID=577310 RepID=UPI00351FC616
MLSKDLFVHRSKLFVKKRIREHGIFLSLLYIPLDLLDKFTKKISIKKLNFISIRKTTKDTVHFRLSGGLGDHLIGLNYILYFSNTFPQYKIEVSGKKYLLEALATNNIPTNWKIVHKPNNINIFCEIEINRFPIVTFFTLHGVKNCPNSLINIIKDYIKFENANSSILRFHPITDASSILYASLNLKNRISQPDLLNHFGISELKFNCIPKVTKLALNRWNLENATFITVNRSIDSESRYITSTKIWPLENYEQLFELLERHLKKIKVVLVGPREITLSQSYSNLINLSGKTTLSELQTLLYYSKLHIGPEGGMVHLRQAMGKKKSVVLFGSTSSVFYGYEGNINVSSDLPRQCCNGCEWAIENWSEVCCISNKNYCQRLVNLNANRVFELISIVLRE